MSAPEIIHACPGCQRISSNGSDVFEPPKQTPMLVDGFRFCSNRCRLSERDEYDEKLLNVQFKVKPQSGLPGVRSNGFRSDRKNS